MSTAAMPHPSRSNRSNGSTVAFPRQRTGFDGRPIVPMTPVVRRRAGREQGRALEQLGHSIEYLMDSRLFLISGGSNKAEAEAVRILTRASREVFAACPEVVPVGERIHRWIGWRVGRSLFGSVGGARRQA